MGHKYTNSKGRTYCLNAKVRVYASGKKGTLHFFSRDERPETHCDLPEGYEVVEGSNGFPLLKRVVRGE